MVIVTSSIETFFCIEQENFKLLVCFFFSIQPQCALTYLFALQINKGLERGRGYLYISFILFAL